MTAFLKLSILGVLAVLGTAAPAAQGTDLLGDPLPAGAVARMGTVRLRHLDGVRSLCLSPDGTVMASAADTRIRLWDAATGRLRDVWPSDGRPPTWARSVAFSPDGRRLAVVAQWLDAHGGTAVIVRDLASGAEALRTKVDEAGAATFSPDGRRLLVWGGRSLSTDVVVHSHGILEIRDAATGERIRQFLGHDGVVGQASFAADGKTLASSSQDNTVRVWDAESGAELRRFTYSEGAKLDSGKWIRASLALAYAADGKRIAWATAKTIEVRELPSGVARHTLVGHDDAIAALTFSPDSARLASAGWDRTVRVWDVATGRSLLELRAHTCNVKCVAFSADGKSLVSGSGDKTIRVWNVETGKPRSEIPGHRERIDDASLSPDGATLVTAGPDGLRVWRTRTGEHLQNLPEPVMASCVAHAPDGKWLAAGSWDDGKIRVWKAEEGSPVAGTGRLLEGPGSSTCSLVFAPDGPTLAAGGGGAGPEIILWNVAEGRRVRSLGRAREAVLELAFSPDGRLLAGRVRDRVYVWQLFPGGWMRELGPEPVARFRDVNAMAFAANSRELLTAGVGGAAIVEGSKSTWDCPRGDAVRFWNIETGERSPRPAFLRDPLTLVPPWASAGKQNVERIVVATAFSPDGSLLAAGEGDGRILIHDTATGKVVGELPGHPAPATRLAFTPDGRHLVSTCSADLTSLVWDLTRLRR